MLEPLPKETVTRDKGKEFMNHQELTDKLKVEVYFLKGSDLTLVDDQTIQLWENKLNNRPRKCLNWKTPYEVFYEEIVHLI